MPFDFGIDIGGTNTKIGLVDGAGRVKARRVLATRATSGPGPALKRVAAVVEELRRRRKVASVGIGIAGLVDHTAGIVRVPPNLPGWSGTAVKRDLEGLIGLPVYCANDANVVALGEWLCGAGRGCRHLLCVTLGTGVGGGIIADGRLLTGANDAAGEIGHAAIFADGLPCECGHNGCVERYIGARYVEDRARKRVRAQQKRLKDHKNQTSLFPGAKSEGPSLMLELARGETAGITMREIGRAARAGDSLALKLVGEVGDYLGTALANAVELLDPERIVIGGGVSRIGRPLLDAVRKSVFRRTQALPGRRLDVVFSELGIDAGIVGASRLRTILDSGF
ncbi:MAG TPA: ROK family protein [bacterium]|nr:ROK family protein [bacterium]